MSGVEGVRPRDNIEPIPAAGERNARRGHEVEEAMIRGAIEVSATRRQERMSNSQIKTVAKIIDKETPRIVELVNRRVAEIDQVKNDSGKVISIGEKLEKELDVEIARISSDRVFSEFGTQGKKRLFRGWKYISQNDWRESGNPENPSLDLYLACVKEQILNQFVNRKCFFEEVSKFINAHKEGILGEMRGDIKKGTQISFEIKEAEGGDTHNGGKLPLKIELSWVEKGEAFFSRGIKQSVTVYYKPRLAKVDEIIVKTWDELRKAGLENAPKPYKIISFSEDKCSIWENVIGQVGDQKKHESAQAYIEDELNLSQTQKEIALEKLRVLESISRYLGLTDLHSENCIFQEDGTAIPIDLEVNDDGEDTGLLRNSKNDSAEAIKLIEFTVEQKKILDETKAELEKCSYRILPLETQYLDSNLRNYNGFYFNSDNHSIFVATIVESIKEKGYTLLEWKGQEYLTKKMIVDFLNYEVSFFSVKEGFMYIGDEISKETCVASEFHRRIQGGITSIV